MDLHLTTAEHITLQDPLAEDYSFSSQLQPSGRCSVGVGGELGVSIDICNWGFQSGSRLEERCLTWQRRRKSSNRLGGAQRLEGMGRRSSRGGSHRKSEDRGPCNRL